MLPNLHASMAAELLVISSRQCIACGVGNQAMDRADMPAHVQSVLAAWQFNICTCKRAPVFKIIMTMLPSRPQSHDIARVFLKTLMMRCQRQSGVQSQFLVMCQACAQLAAAIATA